MTVLRDGTVVNESHNAYHFFTPAECKAYYGLPRECDFITIHHWGAFGQNHDTVRGFLCSRRDDNPTSAHAVLSAGRADSIVSPDNAAFHAGSAEGNARSIGLECRPEATDADYVTVAAYIAFLRGIYGDIPLRPHSFWHNTACPGNWDLVRLDRMARAGEPPVIKPQGNTKPPVKPPVKPAPKPAPKPPVKPAPKPAPKPADTRIRWVMEKGDTLGKISQYYYGDLSHIAALKSYNHISDVNKIPVGFNVFIPGPLVWTIEGPDTIRSIAKYYGLDPAYLAKKNGLSGPDATIYIGNTLKIM